MFDHVTHGLHVHHFIHVVYFLHYSLFFVFAHVNYDIHFHHDLHVLNVPSLSRVCIQYVSNALHVLQFSSCLFMLVMFIMCSIQ